MRSTRTTLRYLAAVGLSKAEPEEPAAKKGIPRPPRNPLPSTQTVS